MIKMIWFKCLFMQLLNYAIYLKSGCKTSGISFHFSLLLVWQKCSFWAENEAKGLIKLCCIVTEYTFFTIELFVWKSTIYSIFLLILQIWKAWRHVNEVGQSGGSWWPRICHSYTRLMRPCGDSVIQLSPIFCKPDRGPEIYF